MIESMANAQIKKIQKLKKQIHTRRQEGLFVVEGWKMVGEALAHSLVAHLYVRESESDSFGTKLQNTAGKASFKDVPVEVVSNSVFQQLSDTVTPQGIMATVRMPQFDRLEVVQGQAGGIYEEAKLLVLENIQDPGNMGTILRTAEGAGISGIVLGKGCVDLFNPKVVRSTMGALFRVPFYCCEDVVSEIIDLKACGFTFYAAHLQGEKDYCDVTYDGKIGIMIGNEANGLSEELSQLADIKVKIPMEGQLESLNAAVSAALFVYEVHRNTSFLTNAGFSSMIKRSEE